MLSLNTEIDDGSIEEVVNGGEDNSESDSASSSGDESMEIADELDPSSNISDMTLSEPPRAPVAAPKMDEDG
ncbi:hypothetical protein HanRHA438_Chr14g0675071 [Helianthus annuus]|nr:hypothetical protein HanRHA438_Chr14g0675071 [Helianthus annuus]